MKTILRILAIVLVITAVASATWAIGQSDWFAQQFSFVDGRNGGRLERGLDNDDGGDSQPLAGNFERGERPDFGDRGHGGHGSHDGGFNLSAATGFARTLLPMALVAAVVIALSWAGQWLRKRRKNQPPSAETAVS